MLDRRLTRCDGVLDTDFARNVADDVDAFLGRRSDEGIVCGC